MKAIIKNALFIACCVVWLSPYAGADTVVAEEDLTPSGQSLGVAVGPQGKHVAVLNMKGSRYVVSIDGVAGPKIDSLLTLDGQPTYYGNNSSDPLSQNQIPVLFSDNGEHSAYLGKIGNEYIVVLDGKELTRGAIVTSFLSSGSFKFTAGGKHLLYTEMDENYNYRVVADGQRGPLSRTAPDVVTSADGNQYVYTGTEDKPAGRERYAVLNGKRLPFFGDYLQFTPTGHVLGVLSGNGTQTLIVDGKPMMKAAYINQPIWTSSKGSIAAVITPQPNQPSFLTIDFKPVPNTQGVNIDKVFFSPDGNHFAVYCRTNANAQFMIIDGKKGQEYQSIASFGMNDSFVMGFTPDSSKFVYVGNSGNAFLVVNDEEWDGYMGGYSPVFGGGGKRIGFTANSGNKQMVVIDGNAKEFPGAHDLSFTADGSHYFFAAGQGRPTIYRDGAEFTGNGIDRFVKTTEAPLANLGFITSPDGEHVLYVGSSSNNPQMGVYLDKMLVSPQANNVRHPMFTPDSRHVMWVQPRRGADPTDPDNTELYVDGKPVVQFASNGSLDYDKSNWSMASDGSLTFVARSKNTIKRFKITPPADSNLKSLLTPTAVAQK